MGLRLGLIDKRGELGGIFAHNHHRLRSVQRRFKQQLCFREYYVHDQQSDAEWRYYVLTEPGNISKRCDADRDMYGLVECGRPRHDSHWKCVDLLEREFLGFACVVRRKRIPHWI
jgi:hypothetical protein